MWKPVEQWSHLISLAIYHPLSSGDSGLPHLRDPAASETYVRGGFARFAWVATCADRQQTMQTLPCSTASDEGVKCANRLSECNEKTHALA